MMKQLLIVLLIFRFSANAQIITTIAGNGIEGFSGDGGAATNAELRAYSVAVDNLNNLYIAEAENHRIRKVNPAGIITTIAGIDSGVYDIEGIPATDAYINGPCKVAVDLFGNVYFNEGVRVRKIDNAGILTTVAGSLYLPYGGFMGGPATAVGLATVTDIAVDGPGNIYIADPIGYFVYKVTTSGIITVIAGNGVSGDAGDSGPATNAQLISPHNVTVDNIGNVYVTDHYKIRKIDTSGIITTVAGNGLAGYSGDGGPATDATFNAPRNITVDTFNNLFIEDGNNYVIRKVSSSGVISTFAGNGIPGYTGDGGSATAAKLELGGGLACGISGNFYIASYNAIRMVSTTSTGFISFSVSKIDIALYPNPTNGTLLVNGALDINDNSGVVLEVENVIGQVVYKNAISTYNGLFTAKVELNNVADGLYFLQIQSASKRNISSFVIDK
jgi:hypothetical protein